MESSTLSFTFLLMITISLSSLRINSPGSNPWILSQNLEEMLKAIEKINPKGSEEKEGLGRYTQI
jgi:hypothetical protein